MDEGDELAMPEKEKFVCLFKIDHLYKPFEHLISKEKFQKILNFLGSKVVLKNEYSFKLEFFFKEEERLKGAAHWEPPKIERFKIWYTHAKALATCPYIFTENFRCKENTSFTLPHEIKQEVMKML